MSETEPLCVGNQLQNIFAPTDSKLAMKLFGSKKALMKERVRQKEIGHWIIHPCSSFRFPYISKHANKEASTKSLPDSLSIVFVIVLLLAASCLYEQMSQRSQVS